MNQAFLKKQLLDTVGSITNILDSYAGRHIEVEEVGQFSIKNIDTNTPLPKHYDEPIIIPLTNINHDVTLFGKSWFSLDVEIPFEVVSSTVSNEFKRLIFDATTEPIATKQLMERTFIFIGYKNSTDAIASYRVLHNGRDVVGSLQSDAVYESFLYHTLKPKCEKNNKNGTYSIYDDISTFDVSKCGVYLSLAELGKRLRGTSTWDGSTPGSFVANPINGFGIRFQLIIPFDCLLPFQYFNLYPNSITGSLELEIKLTARSLVWCLVDYKHSIPKLTHISPSNLTVAANLSLDYILHTYASSTPFNETFSTPTATPAKQLTVAKVDNRKEFAQIHEDIEIPYDMSYLIDTPGAPKIGDSVALMGTMPFKVTPKDIVCHLARSNLEGVKLLDFVRQSLVQHFSQIPFTIPAEIIRMKQWNNSPTPSGTSQDLNTVLIHVKEAIALFPTSSYDLTVFRNPQYKNLQFNFMDRNYPEHPVNTLSPELFRLEIEASNLDTILEATNEYENSYAVEVSGKAPFRKTTYTDGTSFMFLVPCERPNTNIYFSDGIDSKGQGVNIKITGQPIHEGEEDVYYYTQRGDAQPTINTTPPRLALCSDTFWVFTALKPDSGSVGGTCFYEINLSWNEFFQQHYPQLWNKMITNGQTQG